MATGKESVNVSQLKRVKDWLQNKTSLLEGRVQKLEENSGSSGDGYTTYGIQIAVNGSDSREAITYIEDAKGMIPDWNNWKNMPIFKDIKPCILNNGQVLGYLQRDDFTKYENGDSAPITNNAYDVMIEIPKIGYKISTDGVYYYVYITDNPNKNGFYYFAFNGINIGTYANDYVYIGAYPSSLNVSTNALCSVSGVYPTTGALDDLRIQAANRGVGYELLSFFPFTLLQCLYLIVYKERNCYSTLGQGYIGNSEQTGSLNTEEFCHGDVMDFEGHVKFLGLEDFWGSFNQWVDGIEVGSSSGSKLYFRARYEGFDGSTGTSYGSYGTKTTNYEGYVSAIPGTTYGGFIPTDCSGSSSTYWPDYSKVNNTKGTRCYYGGVQISSEDFDDTRGLFSMCFTKTETDNSDHLGNPIGVRLVYKPQQ